MRAQLLDNTLSQHFTLPTGLNMSPPRSFESTVTTFPPLSSQTFCGSISSRLSAMLHLHIINYKVIRVVTRSSIDIKPFYFS
ncbi:hypothetical protein PHYBLDRAFT_138232 [Phycomyces blakesleeanus NRRL 1555(-)]|uniref:Uncharacterized protein n=1 Tax=Phycomyces blakesleeanus (strain ATCC 8743b / DSM 1359 / FGSC 10004 / NBRC 33097 / NRRL 1555) TaxID=763407 RepID=A0A167R2C1_PHYB8|nr:hypothetical protein PHYBLDRAFT_138232 [Phycomyces blakesleeanus NRRL 1555(-)]OAD80687.1 hypothetical protein PHYBLDRAFT_138232 [Phycomyces blakesleeanus NRRL 1555(-)]|eukprot:XP_018298727.1 hypothetical protein PHYBLDRAFT_138232 [Phycomyces blakesleeanus NRRL 1555(-)]